MALQTSSLPVIPSSPSVKLTKSNTLSSSTARNLSATDDLDFKLERDRLKTFVRWPVKFLTPRRMTAAGFYYFNQEDLVRCAFCFTDLGKWGQGDDPMRDHREWAPSCPFVNGQDVGNVPLDSDEEPSTSDQSPRGYDTCGHYRIELRPNSGPEKGLRTGSTLEETIGIHKATGPLHKDYSTYEARMRSYQCWPVSLKQKPNALSEAGFFYTGKGDQTVCFHCGGGLKDWEDSDDPWEEHALWFSKCMYVGLIKGKAFIDKVRAKKQAKPTCKEVQELESPEASLSQGVEVNKEVAKNTPAMETCTPNKSRKVDDALLCKICFTNELGVVFLPCGHIVACVHCAPSLSVCAVCRQPFMATLRAYVP